MPKFPKVAIFMPRDIQNDSFTPCAHEHGVNINKHAGRLETTTA